MLSLSSLLVCGINQTLRCFRFCLEPPSDVLSVVGFLSLLRVEYDMLKPPLIRASCNLHSSHVLSSLGFPSHWAEL